MAGGCCYVMFCFVMVCEFLFSFFLFWGFVLNLCLFLSLCVCFCLRLRRERGSLGLRVFFGTCFLNFEVVDQGKGGSSMLLEVIHYFFFFTLLQSFKFHFNFLSFFPSVGFFFFFPL